MLILKKKKQQNKCSKIYNTNTITNMKENLVLSII